MARPAELPAPLTCSLIAAALADWRQLRAGHGKCGNTVQREGTCVALGNGLALHPPAGQSTKKASL